MDWTLIEQHGLSREEYARIEKALGRPPNATELGIFSVMWSEHCSYKSSRYFLRGFPTTGPQVIQGPGENAGIIDFEGGYALAFKMESHNHPSYIEPYQGAATGVGGILRDVFTMGARPIANLNALRFGAPDHPKTPYLVHGVVAGIGGYGNCVGVPTVGGEAVFDPSFNGNILVNAMTVGLVRKEAIFFGRADGVGNPVLYVGAKTGRDGIHGATMASAGFGEGNETRRPTVQVGDPFTEKLLLEACLEAMHTGVILGIQDMGAAGLTSSTFEMASRSGSGVQLDLDAIPQRERGMTPYELMLSESQERMLMVVQRGRESDVLEIFHRWDLDAHVVGVVTDHGRMEGMSRGQRVIDLPIAPVVHEAPCYERPRTRPAWQDRVTTLDQASLAEPSDWGHLLLTLAGSPNLASRAWIYQQYDHQVGTGTVILPGSDAAVLRVPGCRKGIALSVDCNSRYCYLDPYWGAAHAVAEAARNVACSGARPQALTDCLNFGNPEDPGIMWQFAQAVAGISAACCALDTPVVSGNVSLYNETDGVAIYPTPMVGMVGILDDVTRHCRQAVSQSGDLFYLLGDMRGHLGGSEYLAQIHGLVAGLPPPLDFARERAVQACCIAAIETGLLHSAHDCAEGGLAIAIAESLVSASPALGAAIELPASGRTDSLLFGEAPSRILVSVDPQAAGALETLAGQHHVPCTCIGHIGGDRLQINGWIDIAIDTVRERWSTGLERLLTR